MCVVTTAGKEDVVFSPPITFFRFRGGGQDGDVSSTGDDGDGGPLLREFSRILHLFARCGFGVSLFKGGKSNEETRESTGLPIFHGDLASGDSAEMFSFFGDTWVKSRVGVSKIGVCVLLCFCEAGVFVLLFGANASNRLVVCIGIDIVGACVWFLEWGRSGDLICVCVCVCV